MDEQKINVCRALASIFGEDVSDEETAFVGRCGLDLGLDEGELKLVLQSVGSSIDPKVVLDTVEDDNLRRFLFRRIVAATLIDKHLSDEEKAVVDQVISSFGWDKDAANAYIDHMKAFIEMERKGEELIAKLG
jgi:hypothetical protein